MYDVLLMGAAIKSFSSLAYLFMMSRLTIIVAATHANGIGRDSLLPWRLPKEMKYFARVTTNAPEGHYNAVIMGRNTWESIPQKNRPLVRRVNIVMTRNKDYRLYVSYNITAVQRESQS